MIIGSTEYRILHYWLRDNFKMTEVCETCGLNPTTGLDWACIDGKYSKKRSGYKVLCKSCHRRLDYRKTDYCKYGHKRSAENTYSYPPTGKPRSECVVCRKENHAKSNHKKIKET